MINENVEGVDFIVVNIDLQVLEGFYVKIKLYLGLKLIRGLGVGLNLEVGVKVV